MKKLLFIILSLSLCITMCACGKPSTEEIAAKLQDRTWVYTNTTYGKDDVQMDVKHTYAFEDDMAVVRIKVDSKGGPDILSTLMSSDNTYCGTYSIENTTIHFYPAYEIVNGKNVSTKRETMTLYYTYKNGVLKLFRDEALTEELY